MFLKKNCSETLPVKLLWKMLSLKHIAMVFNLVKKAMILDMLRKLSCPLKVSENVSDKCNALCDLVPFVQF